MSLFFLFTRSRTTLPCSSIVIRVRFSPCVRAKRIQPTLQTPQLALQGFDCFLLIANPLLGCLDIPCKASQLIAKLANGCRCGNGEQRGGIGVIRSTGHHGEFIANAALLLLDRKLTGLKRIIRLRRQCCASERLAERRVLSSRVLWFESDPPARYPELALASVTTHDLPTIAGVWTGADARERAKLGLAVDVDLSASTIRLVGSGGAWPASTADRITTGRLRQLQNVQNDPLLSSSRSTSRYQAVNHRALFIMSPHPPAFDAMFPADTAPIT